MQQRPFEEERKQIGLPHLVRATTLEACHLRGMGFGDVLFKLGNVGAARRYYARALLISYEFRDRFLEAAATLGLEFMYLIADRRTNGAEAGV